MILTIIAFILLFILSIPYAKGFIKNLITSLILLESLIFFSIWGLSILSSLSFKSYTCIWWLICIILTALTAYSINRSKDQYKNYIFLIHKTWSSQSKTTTSIVLLFFFFFIGISAMSIITIPYNYDSMTYHLARIPHWIQNGNTLPYATSNNRQIYSPILCEYSIMHTILLHGNDQFANYVQGFSYICNIIIIFGIARKLDLSHNLSFFSSFLFAMCPMALAQAFSTQTDEFATVWLLCFTYLVIELFECKNISLCKDNIFRVLALSFCFMFGYHSKPTVCIIMFITLATLLIKALRNHDKIKDLLCLLFIAIGIIFIFLIPEFINNLHLYGSITSPNSYGHIVLATSDLRYYILNFYKNISYMFTSGIFPSFDDFLVTLGVCLAGILGISIDDPLISVSTPFTTSEDIYHQDTASYFVFIALSSIVFVIFLVVLFSRKKNMTTFQISYGVIAYLSFFVLLAITIWSPWKCRYFLPNAALLIPFIVLTLKKLFSGKQILYYSFIIIVSAFSLYYGISSLKYHAEYFKNSISEWDDRNELYYVGRIDCKWPMECAIDYITQQGIDDIGLLIGGNTYEYPIWEPFNYAVRIEHIDVSDTYLHNLEDSTFSPKYIIVLEDARYSFQLGDEYVYNDVTYICSNIFENKVQILEIK